MIVIQWSDLAVVDLEAIDDYWSLYSDAAAERVASRIERAAQFLATMPRAGPALHADARKWRIAATPYLLVYRVIDDSIEVLRVRHGKEDWYPEP